MSIDVDDNQGRAVGAADPPVERADLALELDSVTAGYGPLEVLHRVSLRVPRGQMVALLGANGAGKTTVLRAISGEIRHRGRISLNGHDLSGRAPEPIAKRGIGHVPQGRGTFPNLTVSENLRVGTTPRRGWFTGGRAAQEDVEKWLTFFPSLARRLGAKAGSLSGGEQQMLAVARAMMARPSVLLLDEPSLGLAPLITQELMERLAELNRTESVSIVLVEQNARLALRIASWGYVLESGHINISGAASELSEDDRVRRAYLGL